MIDMIELIKAVIFGVVEGITEWLPISSTGHMMLLERVVHLDVSDAFWNMFLVVIQLGAILAVCVSFFSELNVFAPSSTQATRKEKLILWAKIIIACVPAAVVGIPLDDWMEEHLSSPYIIAGALIIYGILFILHARMSSADASVLSGAEDNTFRNVENVQHAPKHFAPKTSDMREAQKVREVQNQSSSKLYKPRITDIHMLDWKTTLGIGAFQVLSIVPGTSRSGSVILGALFLGTSRAVAAKFAFFLAVPVMVGASGLRLVKYLIKGNIPNQNELAILLVGCAVAFLVSLCVVHFLMKFIKNHDFAPFGWYRIILGICVIASGLMSR